MRIPRWGVCVLGLCCCGFVGCSQTGWLRPGAPSDPKTVTSVNGKPVSAVAAVPGTGLSQREDAGDIDPPPAAGSRISGRVFDEEGRAVPNAMVRLGVGGTSGGRVNFAKTDRSGAFTLHGLRPGLNYTLIAEYQGEDGMMSGRVQAKAPDTGVRIGLGARSRDRIRTSGGEVPADPHPVNLVPGRSDRRVPGRGQAAGPGGLRGRGGSGSARRGSDVRRPADEDIRRRPAGLRHVIGDPRGMERPARRILRPLHTLPRRRGCRRDTERPAVAGQSRRNVGGRWR